MVAALDPAPAGLILTSPSNPTGSMIPGPELAAIAAVCRERGIRILSDETYHGITYGARAESVLAYAPDAVVVNTFSKYWCMTGWRLGWAVVPATLVDPMRRFAGNLFLVPPTLSQHVALAAMDAHADLEAHVATYARNRALLTAALAGFGIHRIAPPDGAFYLYADVGDLTRDSLAWCLEILDATGVALNTGRDFDGAQGDRFVRISFAVSTAETLQRDRAARRHGCAGASAHDTRAVRLPRQHLPFADGGSRRSRDRAPRGCPASPSRWIRRARMATTPAARPTSARSPRPGAAATTSARCARASSRPATSARFDLVVAMDEEVYDRLRRIAPRHAGGEARALHGISRPRSAVATCRIRTTAARRASRTCWTWWKRARAACLRR